MHALVAQAVEGETRLVEPANDLGLLHLVVPLEPEPSRS